MALSAWAPNAPKPTASRQSAPATLKNVIGMIYSISTVSAIVASFATKKFAKRLKDTGWECSAFLPEILQFLRKLSLSAAMNFTNGLRNLVLGQGDFIGGPGRVASCRGEMI